jgi:hypothetical protein
MYHVVIHCMSYKEMVGSIYLFLISHFCTLLSACSGLCLRNRVFSQKELLDKSFIFKLLPKVFFFFFTIFRLLRPLKVLLIFLPNDYIFFKQAFLILKVLLSLSNAIPNRP